MTQNIKTRMAPSPTGEYHIGGLRTLLYNYAWAKKNDGRFVLRIEDTDKAREVEGALDRIKSIILDYGFDWDEYYVQSERVDLYKKHANELVEKGHAYYCFCSAERLEELRKEQREKKMPKTQYDGKCRDLTSREVKNNLESGVEHVVRLKVPQNEPIEFDDAILGKISFNSSELEDLVLLKSDGYPTYHLAVVVDDHDMEITHVMRGNEWLPSTPKHVLLYKAFGWNLPIFCHLPNLKEQGMNSKLSKRYGDVHARVFLEKGYLPEAVVNFLMFLGWNPGTEKEIYSLEEFIQEFDISRVHRTDLVSFDREKLLWYNGMYIRNMQDEELLNTLYEWGTKYGVALHTGSYDDKYNARVLGLIKDRMKTLSDFVPLSNYFYNDPTVQPADLFKYTSDQERGLEILKDFSGILSSQETWKSQNLDDVCHSLIKAKDYKPKEAFMTLRLAVTGSDRTPPIFDILEVLGKEVVISRLKTVIENL